MNRSNIPADAPHNLPKQAWDKWANVWNNTEKDNVRAFLSQPDWERQLKDTPDETKMQLMETYCRK
jgi:hypothetical protein